MANDVGLRRKLLLLCILFAFWVIFAASLDRHELVLGAVGCALVMAVTVSLLGRALDPRITPAARIIIDPKLPVDPRIVEYRTYLPDDLPRTVFSDSITLTPGTVTVELKEDVLNVHCLCPYHEEGLAGLEKLVAWLFGIRKEGEVTEDG